jgi:hypothetical protein
MARPRGAPQTRGPLANPKAAIQDWLTLVDPDGAFLTTTELAAVFPHGFEPMPADQRTELRARVADLGPMRRPIRSAHVALGTALDWDDQLVDAGIPSAASARAPEHGIQLRPDLALLDIKPHQGVVSFVGHSAPVSIAETSPSQATPGRPAHPTPRHGAAKVEYRSPGHRRRPVVPSLGPPGRPGRFMSVARR